MPDTMMYLRLMIPAAALTISALCSTAEARSDRASDQYQYDRESAQSSDQSSRMNRDDSRSMRNDRTSQRRSQDRYHWRQMTGEIERVKKVNIRGTTQDHLAVLVFTDLGNRVVADLGPANDLRDVELLTGERISARGPVFRINDRLVMFAKQMRADGETIKIRRQDREQQDDSRHTQPGRQTDQRQEPTKQQLRNQVSGEVKDVKELTVKGMNKTHQVVRLKTEKGNQIIADLGTKKDLRDLTIISGRQLTVQGKTMRVENTPFILADQVTADGKTVQIDREMLSSVPELRGDQARSDGGEQQSPSGTRSISGQVMVKGEVLKVDRDGFYIVKDEKGREVHMIVSEMMNRGINVGDRIQAQVQPDGTVTSIARSSDSSPESTNQSSGSSAQIDEQQQ